MAIGRLTAARLAVLPFAPALWAFFVWVAASGRKLAPKLPKSLRAPILGVVYSAVLVGLLYAQGDVYQRMTGIRVLAGDNYFFTLFVSEIIVGIALGFRLLYRDRRKERSGAAK
jgi:hypothetical protein